MQISWLQFGLGVLVFLISIFSLIYRIGREAGKTRGRIKSIEEHWEDVDGRLVRLEEMDILTKKQHSELCGSKQENIDTKLEQIHTCIASINKRAELAEERRESAKQEFYSRMNSMEITLAGIASDLNHLTKRMDHHER